MTDERPPIKVGAHGVVTHASGTAFIVVVVDRDHDADEIREAILDKLADQGGVIVEEVDRVE